MSRQYGQAKKPAYTGSPWAIDPSSFNPANFLVNPLAAIMNPFMQTAAAMNAYANQAGATFNRNFGWKEDFGVGRYQNQGSHNSYQSGGFVARFSPRGRGNVRRDSSYGGRGRSSFSGRRNAGSGSSRESRNKRTRDASPVGRTSAKKSKTSESYDPEEPMREEVRSDSGRGRSSVSGRRKAEGSSRESRIRDTSPVGGTSARKSKTSELYNPEEPTREEDDEDDDPEDDDNVNYGDSEGKSSKFGANALSQDWKKDSDGHYCTVCECDFSGSFLTHRRTKDHRKHRYRKFPRCRLCRKTFQGTKEFENHAKTEEHKKECEDFQAQKDQQLIEAAMSDSEDKETALKRYISNQGGEEISDDCSKPVGEFHVVPLKTFFCKLCQKFFSNYTDGREIHCQTPDHIQKYKEYRKEKEDRAMERSSARLADKKEGEEGEKQQEEEGNENTREEQEINREGGEAEEGEDREVHAVGEDHVEEEDATEDQAEDENYAEEEEEVEEENYAEKEEEVEEENYAEKEEEVEEENYQEEEEEDVQEGTGQQDDGVENE